MAFDQTWPAPPKGPPATGGAFNGHGGRATTAIEGPKANDSSGLFSGPFTSRSIVTSGGSIFSNTKPRAPPASIDVSKAQHQAAPYTGSGSYTARPDLGASDPGPHSKSMSVGRDRAPRNLSPGAKIGGGPRMGNWARGSSSNFSNMSPKSGRRPGSKGEEPHAAKIQSLKDRVAELEATLEQMEGEDGEQLKQSIQEHSTKELQIAVTALSEQESTFRLYLQREYDCAVKSLTSRKKCELAKAQILNQRFQRLYRLEARKRAQLAQVEAEMRQVLNTKCNTSVILRWTDLNQLVELEQRLE